MTHVIVSSNDPIYSTSATRISFSPKANPGLANAFAKDARFKKQGPGVYAINHNTDMLTSEVLDFLVANGCRVISTAGTNRTWMWTLVKENSLGMEPVVQRPGLNQAMLVQQQPAAIASQQKVVEWMHAGDSKVTPNLRNNPAATGQQGGPHKLGKQHHNQTPQQSILIQGQGPLTAAMLARASLQEQKQMLGECLFPLISVIHRDLAPKLTGMLLEMENSEILHMLESGEALRTKVDEAVDVIRTYKAKAAKKEG